MLLTPLKTLLGFALLALIAAWMGCADSAPVAPHPAGKAHLSTSTPSACPVSPFIDPNLERAVRKTLDPLLDIPPNLAHVTPLTANDLALLTKLDASSKNIQRLEGLEHLTNLRFLNLSDNAISDMTPLARLTNLDSLALSSNPLLTDVTPLASLTNLKWLRLGDNDLLTDLSPLRSLTNLRSLYLDANDLLMDLSPLDSLTNLRHLRLTNNDLLADVNPLANLTNLRHLRLMGNPLLTNVNPLANLTNLDTLRMHSKGNRSCAVSDLSDFGLPGKLPNLKLITVVGCPLSEASRTALDSLEARGVNVN